METETYKNAKLILERFDTDSKKKMVRFVLLYISKKLPSTVCLTDLWSACRSLSLLLLDLSWLQNQDKVMQSFKKARLQYFS